ncbi:acylphosphatase [Halalkalibacterium halodurans]|uniref:Acylphosphatase n=2 Tax=Halalkalibacterium halodurans TaxID=86665 RepID=Q9K6S2_HALH5|nr:acylphosphatase [Halalkalibacterium halodurans]MED4174002.1 acylphosphatase [Halalkalibacterium halodurans]BAB07373.1 BH3654 [Halalkalibacterium halodurans C-125]BAB64940.1 L-glutamate-dependent ATP hydrolase paralogue [Halalkalibacterium halodurans]
MEQKRTWLPHLENSIPEKLNGNKISMYAIALEGWRRGLTLKFSYIFADDKIKVVYSLANEEKEHQFAVSRGDKVTKEAISICINKDITKEYLEKANVPVPEGKGFNEAQADSDIIQYAKELGFPVVIKPTDGLSGKGVVVNIQNEEMLREAISYVREQLAYSNVVVERYFEGEDFRIYIMGDQVIGAVTRVPANVVGDGKRTIKQLIKLKNKARNKNPNLQRRPIKLDHELEKTLNLINYTIDSIPSKGERVILNTKSNISTGGEPVDVTDQLTPEIKKIAVQAAKAIPGLIHCAVDMLVDKENNNGVVLEINSKPQIGAHLFPMEGKAVNIPRAIIDYYFPETKEDPIPHRDMYTFDIMEILNILTNGIAKEVKVPRIPKLRQSFKCYTVSGRVQGVGYQRWVKKIANKLKLHGFVKNLSNGDVQIVVAGYVGNVKKMRSILESESPLKAVVKNVKEQNWEKPVQIGFKQILDEIDLEDYEKLKKDKLTLEQEIKALEQKYKEIASSRTWRISQPVRKILDVLRKTGR